MADPLSIVASICGIASLADTVVTKAYKYLKAVRECEEEVRSLIVELNVFSAVLGRLARLAKDNEDEDDDDDDDDIQDALLSTLLEPRLTPHADRWELPQRTSSNVKRR